MNAVATIKYIIKWAGICLLVGLPVGSVVAFFLATLDIATTWRENHLWVIYLLPIAGLLIALIYHYYGGEANKGNNLLLEAHQLENKRIPLSMAPLVFISTILTHIAGGSAGREGTAVQIGGAIADQFTPLFKLNTVERKTVLIIGISAGFAAVFGTPLAGAIFALEIMLFKNIKLAAIVPSFAAAYIAHYTCLFWGIEHTQYFINTIPAVHITTCLWAALAGIIFGLTALLFSYTGIFWTMLFSTIKNKLLIPVLGGIVLALVINYIGTTKFIGLGIPSISNAFMLPAGNFDFIIKLLFTTFTLSAGFKGGEVTPLFFIGATLGNILIWFIPLPMALLAGMGFVAVFAGATHCVITSIVLGIEIFGLEAGVYIGIASILAYFMSGVKGIYSAQQKEGAKYSFYNYIHKLSKR
ncbi:MAG: chloride channel protein [Sediminibacterium sp.]